MGFMFNYNASTGYWEAHCRLSGFGVSPHPDPRLYARRPMIEWAVQNGMAKIIVRLQNGEEIEGSVSRSPSAQYPLLPHSGGRGTGETPERARQMDMVKAVYS